MGAKQLTFYYILGLLIFFGLVLFIWIQYTPPKTEKYSRMDTLPNFSNPKRDRRTPTPKWFNTFGPQFGVPLWIETDPPQPFANVGGIKGDIEHFTTDPHIGESYDAPSDNVLPPFQVENSTYWPQYYYAFPYDKSTYAWPPGMFSRSYNWYPGFSSGSGESYYKRPSKRNENAPRPRNAWIRNSTSDNGNPRFFVSNRGEYQFNQDNYRGF